MALDATIGGASSDSYVTLVEWQDYWLARGVNLTQHGHDESHEANLRRAADIMDAKYSWVGIKQYKVQARAWPRLYVPLIDGFSTDPDTIPKDVKSAQMELAYLIHEGADPFATIEALVKSETKTSGPLSKSVEYAGGKGTPRYVAVDTLLRDYVTTSQSGVRLVRA